MQVVCPVCGEILNHNDKVKNTNDYVCPYCYSKFEVIIKSSKAAKGNN